MPHEKIKGKRLRTLLFPYVLNLNTVNATAGAFAVDVKQIMLFVFLESARSVTLRSILKDMWLYRTIDNPS
jgi:hypothetical protein